MFMKFLEYSKKLYEKVSYYDSVVKQKNSMFTNPFARLQSPVTIIWVDKKE